MGPLLYGHISSPLPSILVRSLKGIHTGVWWFLLHLVFFPPILALWAPYFLLFSVSSFPLLLSTPHPHASSLSFPPPPSLFSLSPSPIPLSQLPVELAAIQDLADGSVIRSASLRSLFSSPFFFLSFFSLFNQITEENFSPFGFEFCRHSLILALRLE